MLGNIRFIGELGKLEIVAEQILHLCIQQLFPRKSNVKDAAEDLECLCQIMKTCGRILDTEKAKPLMNQYFDRIAQYAENPELPLRIKFMLLDTMQLRIDNWVPRKATTTEGPMLMDQVCFYVLVFFIIRYPISVELNNIICYSILCFLNSNNIA